MNLKPADKYVRCIRNQEKQQYAYQFLYWLRHGEQGEEPDERSVACSVIAAQAVRMNLRELIYKD